MKLKYSIIILIKLVITDFVVNVQHDQDKGYNTNGQAKYIDKCCDLISPQDPGSDLKEALQHTYFIK